MELVRWRGNVIWYGERTSGVGRDGDDWRCKALTAAWWSRMERVVCSLLCYH